jgi:uncharacterized coiled-coil protein SlyX
VQQAGGSLSPLAAQQQTQAALREMMQQQLMVAVSQCNQQLMMQQMDMGQLHRQIQQLTNQMAALTHQGLTTPPSNPPPPPLPGLPPANAASHHHHHHPYLSPLTASTLAAVPNNVATSVNVQSSRQTTFTVNPNFTSNPFATTQGPVPAQTRFPSSHQAVQTSDPFAQGNGHSSLVSSV